MTISEFRELLLALAGYATDAADMGHSEYNWDEQDVSHAHECADKARKIEAELKALDDSISLTVLLEAKVDAHL